MLSCALAQKSFWDNSVEAYILFMTEKLELASDLSTLDFIEKNFYPCVREILKRHKFEGKNGQQFVLTAQKDKKFVEFIFLGLGACKKENYQELELFRRALASGILTLKRLAITSAVVSIPVHCSYGINNYELLTHMCVTGIMSSYSFDTFKIDKDKDKKSWDCTLYIEPTQGDANMFQKALSDGIIVGRAINNIRLLADTPANIMTPTQFSNEAKKISDKYKLNCTIFGRDKAQELSMGGFLAVDSGSDQDGKFIILEYTPQIKSAPTVALVGKGVCFDTGGVSLKTSSGMEGMKFDMSGAAAVLGTMEIIAQLKPDVHVVGLMPMVENMPSGKAARQDDIITFMNGKTAEIKSTDAEGRLILADALCYAEKFFEPEVMIDVATLTGACVIALGHFYTGLMTRDKKLRDILSLLGEKTGDRVWALPLDDDFVDANRSEVADVANAGSPAYRAGTVTAACFLENFVSKSRWVHLDIAGTCNDVPGINYVGKGASGAGVRLLTEFIMTYGK